jgi:hypothetical protein
MTMKCVRRISVLGVVFALAVAGWCAKPSPVAEKPGEPSKAKPWTWITYDMNEIAPWSRPSPDLKGQVKSVTTEVADITEKDGKTTEGPRKPSQTTEYNSAGDAVKTIDYGPSGIRNKYLYEYDSNGKLISRESWRNSSKVPLLVDYSLASRTEYKFGPDGHASGGTTTGSQALSSTYKWDKAGNITEMRILDKDGKLVERYALQYDSSGRPSMTAIYAADGSLELKSTTTRKGKTGHQEQAGKPTYDFVVDDNGNTVSATRTGPDGKKLGDNAFTYEYDSHGNWTKRIERRTSIKDGKSEDEQPTRVTYRTITYY